MEQESTNLWISGGWYMMRLFLPLWLTLFLLHLVYFAGRFLVFEKMLRRPSKKFALVAMFSELYLNLAILLQHPAMDFLPMILAAPSSQNVNFYIASLIAAGHYSPKFVACSFA
jgi:hypothetical protein